MSVVCETGAPESLEAKAVEPARVVNTSQAAKAMKVTVSRLHALISKDRIQGAYRSGAGRGVWMIPVKSNGKPVVLPPEVPVGRPKKVKTK